MKSIEEQLSTYKSVHLNKKNVMTHFIGVPLIIWSLLVILGLFKLPLLVPIIDLPLSAAMVFFVIVLAYYLKLSAILALASAILLSPILYIAQQVAQLENAIWIALAVFLIGWLIQFLGHHFEKAKPAFVDDINQLLIGPLFLLAEILFSLGCLKELNRTITPMAIDKRRKLAKD